MMQMQQKAAVHVQRDTNPLVLDLFLVLLINQTNHKGFFLIPGMWFVFVLTSAWSPVEDNLKPDAWDNLRLNLVSLEKRLFRLVRADCGWGKRHFAMIPRAFLNAHHSIFRWRHHTSVWPTPVMETKWKPIFSSLSSTSRGGSSTWYSELKKHKHKHYFHIWGISLIVECC